GHRPLPAQLAQADADGLRFRRGCTVARRTGGFTAKEMADGVYIEVFLEAQVLDGFQALDFFPAVGAIAALSAPGMREAGIFPLPQGGGADVEHAGDFR